MPKTNQKDKLHDSRLKNKLELTKLRSERDKAILKLKDKIEIARLKENKIKGEIRSENIKEKTLERKTKAKDRADTTKLRQTIAANKKSISEEKIKQREEIALIKKEISIKELTFKREHKAELLLLKEEFRNKKIENRKHIEDVRTKEREEKLSLSKDIEKRRIEQRKQNLETNEEIEAAKDELFKQKNDLKNLRDSQRLAREQKRNERLKIAKLDKEERIEQKRERNDLYKAKKLELKTGVVQSRVEDAIEIDSLTQEISEQEVTIAEQITESNIEVEAIKAPETNLVETEEETYVPEDISFDEEYTDDISETEVQSANVSAVQTFGKAIVKRVEKAEETAIDAHLKRYKGSDNEEIVSFRELVNEEEPIHIKSLMKYMFVLNGTKVEPEKIHELYIGQISSLLFGKTVQFGKGFIKITERRGNKTTYSNSTEDESKEVFSIFPEEGNEEFNKLIAKKINSGSAIKIAKGLLIYKRKGQIIVLADTNYKGA